MHRAAIVLSLAATAVLAAACGGGHAAHPADPNTTIDVTGSIGGIHARESRAAVERVLGPGRTISTVTHRPRTGTITLRRVRYAASGLLVVYVQSPGRPQWVFGVFTSDSRYRTASGLGVGSPLVKARGTPGVRCYDQKAYVACQGGLGYEKPIVSFTVRSGRVVRVFMAAVAD
ncbi:MAG TPA: hypothetical protein VGL44_14285 [Gaiellales bacterium]